MGMPWTPEDECGDEINYPKIFTKLTLMDGGTVRLAVDSIDCYLEDTSGESSCTIIHVNNDKLYVTETCDELDLILSQMGLI